jgi:nucleoside 2-deoxyribosyltransferase
MKIYIAGPMTGIKKHNIPAFKKAERKFKNKGYVVLNPACLPESSEITKEQYIDIDLAMVRSSDVIYMLRGWKDSKGAFLEHAYALYLCLKIIYQP